MVNAYEKSVSKTLLVHEMKRKTWWRQRADDTQRSVVEVERNRQAVPHTQQLHTLFVHTICVDGDGKIEETFDWLTELRDELRDWLTRYTRREGGVSRMWLCRGGAANESEEEEKKNQNKIIIRTFSIAFILSEVLDKWPYSPQCIICTVQYIKCLHYVQASNQRQHLIKILSCRRVSNRI